MIHELEMVARLILGFVLSGAVGLEREASLKPAGLRTHILVGLGATLLTILSLHAFPGSEPSRVAASIIVGVGQYRLCSQVFLFISLPSAKERVS